MNNEALLKAVQTLQPVADPRHQEERQNKTETKPEGTWTDELLEDALTAAGVEIYDTERETHEGQLHTKYYIPCPNEAAHTTPTGRRDAAVWIYHGWPVFKCLHAHCSGWRFPDYAQAVGIEYRKKTGRVPDNEKHYYSHFYQWKQKQDGTEIATKVIDLEIVNWICSSYDFFIMGEMP